MLVLAAVTWRQETGGWDSNDLAWLHHESARSGPRELDAVIRAAVPDELADELRAAVENASDPEEADDGGAPGA